MLSITDKNNEKFFVENLLETHNFNRKRRKDFSEDPILSVKDEDIQSSNATKKPNLKFGIDSILRPPKEGHNFRQVVKCMNRLFLF